MVPFNGYMAFGDTRKRVGRSILLNVVLLALGQILIYALVTGLLAREDKGLLFYPITLLFHTILYFALMSLRSYFRRFPSGEPLNRVNLANKISLFRLSSLPTLFSLVLLSHHEALHLPLLLLTCLVFLSDLIDGIVSRRLKQITAIGKFLDSSSDYLLLMIFAVALLIYELLPLWLFALILGRGFLMGIGMIIVSVKEGAIHGETTFMGKLWVSSMMLLFALELLRLFEAVPEAVVTLITGGEYVAGMIVVLSVADKISFLRRRMRNPYAGDELSDSDDA